MKKNFVQLTSLLKNGLSKRAVYYILIPSILFCQLSFSQPTPWQQKKIDSLFSAWNNQQGPGMELMVIHKGKVVLNKSYGLANIDRKEPNNSNGRIWVASMSKQFTALAIALLIDRKKISLEDDIRKYLPELPFLGDPVTIRNLIYHTSGLRDGFVLTAMSFKTEDEYSDENVIKYLSMQKGRNFRPGERFEYNNGGYVLLATIVERVSGQSFPDFVQQNIFKPLGMNRSAFYGRFPSNDSNIVTGYAVSMIDNKNIYKPAYFKGNSYGSTGLITTADDLAKWDRVFYEPVFGKKLQQLQVQAGVLNNGQLIPYAFGLEVDNFKGKKAITHSGSDAGYKSEMVRFPKDQLTVICLANTEDAYNNTDRLFKVAELFIDFKKEKSSNFGATCKPVDGIYVDQATLSSMRFVDTADEPTVAASPDGYQQLLVEKKNCQFLIKDIETDSYTFQNNELLYVTHANKEIFHPIKKISASQAELKEKAGTYYSEELGVSYKLFEKEGVLFLKFFDVYDVPLIAYLGGVFAGEFLGTNILRFVKDESGKVVRMEFNREGIHGLIFSRKE